MRISFRESYCTPTYCLRSLFCCYLPPFVRTKDSPNLAPISSSNPDQNSSASHIPISGSDAIPDSIVVNSTEEKVSALNVEEVKLKSCLKRSGRERKQNVKWIDLLGKKLVEIKEFEPSELESIDDVEGNTLGACSIQ